MNTLTVFLLLALAPLACVSWSWPTLHSCNRCMYGMIWPTHYAPVPKLRPSTITTTVSPSVQDLAETMTIVERYRVEECYFNQTWKRIPAHERTENDIFCFELDSKPELADSNKQYDHFLAVYKGMAQVSKDDTNLAQKCYWKIRNGVQTEECKFLAEESDGTPRSQFRHRVYQRMKQAESMCTNFFMDFPMCDEYNASKAIHAKDKTSRRRRRIPRKANRGKMVKST